MEKHFCLDDSPRFRMIELGEVDSTNNFLRHLDTPGDCRTTLVTAEYQTAGRGADTNRWESARGENLLFSLRVMPAGLPASRMFAISEGAALAVREAVASPATGPLQTSPRGGLRAGLSPSGETEGGRSGEAFSLKWPNDIYYGDSKVAGILIENDLQGPFVTRSTIGIGINVNQRCFLSDAPNPRSLADIVGHDLERRFVLEQFMEHFTRRMQQIDRGELDALHHDYMQHLYRLGQEHDYCDKDGTFRATITDVEPTGHLILRDAAGTIRRYAFKEVRFCITGNGEQKDTACRPRNNPVELLQ